jgi:hypothetical protein
MDAVEKYNQYVGEKEDFLRSLEKRICELKKIKPDFSDARSEVLRCLEKKTGLLLMYEAVDAKKIGKGDLVIGITITDRSGFNGLRGRVVELPAGGYSVYYSDYDSKPHFTIEFEETKKTRRVLRKNFKKLEKKDLRMIEKKAGDFKDLACILTEMLLSADKRKFWDFKRGDKVRIRPDSEYYQKYGDFGVGKVFEKGYGFYSEPFKVSVEFFSEGRKMERSIPILNLEYAELHSFRDKAHAREVVEGVLQHVGRKKKFNQEYEAKKNQLIEDSIPVLRQFGMTSSSIIDYFSRHLGEQIDPVEGLEVLL